jgi:hypothetical protein
MDDERTDLLEQIERCRRIAMLMTDEEMRRSLEELAHDYELKLRRKRGRGFMLRDR